MRFRVLLVDDEPLVLGTTQGFLEEHGFDVETAPSGAFAVELVKQDPTRYALAVVDYRMDGLDGKSTIEALRRLAPELFVLVYSGDGSRDAVRLTWQAGAVGFLDKTGEPEELLEAVRSWYRKYEETVAVLPATSDDDAMVASIGMVGRSRALRDIAHKVERYRKVKQNILIQGETGTGKELVARAIHLGSEAPFIPINCASYRGSSDLLESELFGYERGAFTGATNEKKGVFELVKGGTVFLDEIHHLSPTAQAKLLRVIQEKRIRRVGGSVEYDVQFRLVTASKPDLEERCERGEFLTDLYHRISVLNIAIPALRCRIEDIEPLVSSFCKKYEEETGEKKRFLLRTLKYLEAYHWPGNVRELENAVYQILTDTAADRIAPEHLDAKFFREREDIGTESYAELRKKLDLLERNFIARVLKVSRNKSDAARRMGIAPTTLQSMMERVGLVERPARVALQALQH